MHLELRMALVRLGRLLPMLQTMVSRFVEWYKAQSVLLSIGTGTFLLVKRRSLIPIGYLGY